MAQKPVNKEQSATTAFGNIGDNFDELYGIVNELPSFDTSKENGYNTNGVPLGADVMGNNFALGEILSAVNSVIMQKEIKSSKVRLPVTYTQNGSEKFCYTHGSNLVVYNGKAYVTCFFNKTGADHFEYSVNGVIQDTRIAMFIFNLSTWAIEKVTVGGVQQDYQEVIKHSDAVDGGLYIASGAGDPIIFVKDGVVTIAATCRLSASADDSAPNGDYYMVYREYTISSGTWGTIKPCKFKASANAEAVDMNATNFKSALGISSWSNWFNMFAQYAEYQPTKDKDGNNLSVSLPKEYYVCVASDTSLNNGVIVRTQDFHTFTYWMIPEWTEKNPINLKYEMALFTIDTTWGKALRCAARTAGETEMFIGTIDFDTYNTDGSVNQVGSTRTNGGEPNKQWRLIPDGGSRPCFMPYHTNNSLFSYLFHMTDIGSRSRKWDAVEFMHSNTLVAASVSRIATPLWMTYPSIALTTINDEKWYVVSYTYEGGGVYMSKFKPFKTLDDVIPMLAKMIDAFEPEEE